MKKNIFKLLLTLICTCFIFASCTSIDNTGSSSEQTSSETSSQETSSKEETSSEEASSETSSEETSKPPQTAKTEDFALYFQTARYDEIKDKCGKLVATSPDEMNDFTIYEHEDVSMSLDANGTIQSITLHENAPQNYELNEITTGMKRSDVIAKLGTPFAESDATDNPFITYEIEINGGVSGFKLYFNSSDVLVEAMLMNYIPNGMIE